MEDDPDTAQLRELAAKCRRLAEGMSDRTTATALRQMAAEYESLADSKDRALQPASPPQIIL